MADVDVEDVENEEPEQVNFFAGFYGADPNSDNVKSGKHESDYY